MEDKKGGGGGGEKKRERKKLFCLFFIWTMVNECEGSNAETAAAATKAGLQVCLLVCLPISSSSTLLCGSTFIFRNNTINEGRLLWLTDVLTDKYILLDTY